MTVTMDDADNGAVPEPPHIKFATYNILSGRKGRLEMALCEMDRLNVGFAFLTEAKLTRGIHTRRGFGYSVFTTDAVSPHKGGVTCTFRHYPPQP